MNESQQADDGAARENAFPENELPKWLFRQAVKQGRKAAVAARGPEYKLLAGFARDLGTCTRSGVDAVASLELCLKPLRKSRLGDCWSGAVNQVRKGSTLADALRPAKELLPPFYLPVIEAGEMSGRLDEALSFLERHCNLLAGPASALRNVWLFPLAIVLAGSVIKVVLTLAMGHFAGAFSTLGQELLWWASLAVIVAIVMLTPARHFVDRLRLSLPLVGALEREIALHRFFRVLALLYSVSGQRVEVMIRTAAKTVSNRAARIELSKAATAIEEKTTIADAFRCVSILTDNERTTIHVGEMSGKLEQTFDQISKDTEGGMTAKLKILQPLLVRIVMVVVTLSIIGTMLSLIL